MHRRDLLKGALIFPALTGVNSWAQLCVNHGACQAASQPFQLILQGPFGLVLHNAPNITAITAFMPVDPDSRHRFAFQKKRQDITKTFNFELRQSKASKISLCIDTQFKDFCVEKTTWSPNIKPVLLKINLPVPVRIVPEADMPPISITLPNSTSVLMPPAYVLEYDTAASEVELVDKISGVVFPSQPTYTFEVGLEHDDSDTPDYAHARKFYNETLLAFFPELQNASNRRIKNVTELKTNRTPNRPNKPKNHAISGTKTQEHILTTTFECKAGGIIAGTTS